MSTVRSKSLVLGKHMKHAQAPYVRIDHSRTTHGWRSFTVHTTLRDLRDTSWLTAVEQETRPRPTDLLGVGTDSRPTCSTRASAGFRRRKLCEACLLGKDSAPLWHQVHLVIAEDLSGRHVAENSSGSAGESGA
mgnify:FL=1